MNVVWNERKTAEAIERRQRGETLKQIADALGTSATPVFLALRKAGIPAPPKNYIRWSLDMDEKLMMMREQKMPIKAVSEEIGVHVSAAIRRCNELKIDHTLHPKVTPEMEEDFLRRAVNGEDYLSIASSHGVCLSTVARRFRGSGLKRRGMQVSWSPLMDGILTRMWLDGDSAKEISKAINVGCSAVYYRVKTLEIDPSRERKPKKRRLQKHENVKRMVVERRLRGETQSQIAEALGISQSRVAEWILLAGLRSNAPKVKWSSEMDSALRAMRAARKSRRAMAKSLDVSENAIYGRCKVLGI